MQLTNKHNLPAPLVSVFSNDPYEFDGDISTTAMIQPPRIRQLKKRHGKQVVEDVSDLVFALIGNNTHYILERVTAPGCIKEVRYYATALNWKIGGQIDLLETNSMVLSDYKVTSVWSVIAGLKPEHEQQANINAFLLMENGLIPEKLQIVNFLRDWSKHKANEDNYPSCQVWVQPVPLWGYTEAKRFVERRVLLHQESESIPDNELPVCTPEERWERPTKYAVMKKNRKSALRLLDTEETAKKYMEEKELDKNHYIEVRPGENVRCNSYCNVNRFCNFFNTPF